MEIDMDVVENDVVINNYLMNSNSYNGLRQTKVTDSFFNTRPFETQNFKLQPRDNISTKIENDFTTDILSSLYNPIFKPLKQSNIIINPPVFVPDTHNSTLNREQSLNVNRLKPVSAIPEKFQRIFTRFPVFNFIQSKVFDDVLYTDKSVVVSAPTGSGKTVIFELAIVRLLMKHGHVEKQLPKIVYMAPVKALCSEKCREWTEKFTYLGITCSRLTGDTEGNEYTLMQSSDIILTTPEKWDKLTRCWSNNEGLIQLVKLFLIDEVHLLNCDTRGPTLEAVVSRMKMLQTTHSKKCHDKMRFLAVSATIPNADDISKWLNYDDLEAISIKVGEEMRPVQLKKIVLSYPFPENWSQFRFDMSLSYKVASIIRTYSDGRPTLVFCSTRNGVIETARVIAKEMNTLIRIEQKQKWFIVTNTIKDVKLKEVLKSGVCFHHAGLDLSDRQQTEGLFASGELPILVATSTLAMGVNLPAHLVVIKSTFKFHAGTVAEYTESEILQMIGRAGRPQYDSCATAVVMTTPKLKDKYQSLIGGTQLIESHLHKHLIEHLNAEIVLRTINNMGVLLPWIRSTFLYVRVLRHSKFYGIDEGLNKDTLESKLLDICVRDINILMQNGIVLIGEDGLDLKPTQSGRLMARYCLAFETMKLFINLSNEASFNDLVNLLAFCKEFTDITLRTSEKKTLNSLNEDKHKTTIRFHLDGKIKTREMKINCLIQASLGNITIQDSGLNQEVLKIMRISQRISKCLADFIIASRTGYKVCLNALLFSKCVRAQLWENSYLVAKQLDKIGVVMANSLVRAGLTTFKKIEETNPRELEMVVNRHPPFGNQILRSVSILPKYQIDIEEGTLNSPTCTQITISVKLANMQTIAENKKEANVTCFLLIGNMENNVVFIQKITKIILMESSQWRRKVDICKCSKGNQLHIHLINEDFVGVDIHTTFTPKFDARDIEKSGNIDEDDDEIFAQFDFSTIETNSSSNNQHEIAPVLIDLSDDSLKETHRHCNHTCANKSKCRHMCCKNGVRVRHSKRKLGTKEALAKQSRLEFVHEFTTHAAKFAITSKSDQQKRLSLKQFMPSPPRENSEINDVVTDWKADHFHNEIDKYNQPEFSLKFDYSTIFTSSENTSSKIHVLKAEKKKDVNTSQVNNQNPTIESMFPSSEIHKFNISMFK